MPALCLRCVHGSLVRRRMCLAVYLFDNIFGRREEPPLFLDNRNRTDVK